MAEGDNKNKFVPSSYITLTFHFNFHDLMGHEIVTESDRTGQGYFLSTTGAEQPLDTQPRRVDRTV